VGRSPWTAAGAHAGFRVGWQSRKLQSLKLQSRTRGSGADEGVRPTYDPDSI
jgi:hypothetical protein